MAFSQVANTRECRLSLKSREQVVLSQNRGDEDYHNIVARLDEREDEMSHGVAEAMKAKRPSG